MSRGLASASLLASVIVVLQGASVSAQMPVVPEPGLRIVYDVTLKADRQPERKASHAQVITVTCRKGSFVRVDRILRDGGRTLTTRTVFYRMLVPSLVETVLKPGNRRTVHRYTYPRKAADDYIAAGGKRKTQFSASATTPGQGSAQNADVVIFPLRRGRTKVAAGAFDAVVFETHWTLRNIGGRGLNLVVHTRAWIPPKLGYAVRIVTTQTFSGSHKREEVRTYAASRIMRAAPSAGGCDGVPAN